MQKAMPTRISFSATHLYSFEKLSIDNKSTKQ